VKCIGLSLLLAALGSSVLAQPAGGHAQAPRTPPTECEQRARKFGMALGFGLAEELRSDYGSSVRGAFSPELLALGYVALPLRDLYLRPGVRLGYDGLGQPDMPREVRVAERSLREQLELGLVYDWVVVPALSMGAGLLQRFIELETRGSVMGTHALNHREQLGVIYGALGLGIPIERGLVVIEPFVRLQHVFSDNRALLRVGVDVSLRL